MVVVVVVVVVVVIVVVVLSPTWHDCVSTAGHKGHEVD